MIYKNRCIVMKSCKHHTHSNNRKIEKIEKRRKNMKYDVYS